MPSYAPRKLTKGFIDDLPYDGTGYLVRDTKVTGLLIAVNKTVKTYKVQRDLWRGQRGRRQLIKTVRLTLGSTEELTLDEARLKAEDRHPPDQARHRSQRAARRTEDRRLDRRDSVRRIRG